MIQKLYKTKQRNNKQDYAAEINVKTEQCYKQNKMMTNKTQNKRILDCFHMPIIKFGNIHSLL